MTIHINFFDCSTITASITLDSCILHISDGRNKKRDDFILLLPKKEGSLHLFIENGGILLKGNLQIIQLKHAN